jgi:hypothetical protein
MIKTTGHAEIDQQHSIIENSLLELMDICSEKEQNPNTECSECSSQKQQECTLVLASSYSKLQAYLIGHNTYEEKMMDLLPNTSICLAHLSKRAFFTAYNIIFLMYF